MLELTKKNNQDLLEIVNSVKPSELFNCFFVVSNDCLKQPNKAHRDKKDNIIEYILNGCPNIQNLYASATYGTVPNETCRHYLRKRGLGGYNGWFNMFLVCLYLKKQELIEYVKKGGD